MRLIKLKGKKTHDLFINNKLIVGFVIFVNKIEKEAIEKVERIEGRCEGNLKRMRTLGTAKRMLVILVFTLICTGCAGSSHHGTQSASPGSLNNLSIDKDIGAEHPPVLLLGSMFAYQDTNLSTGKICKVTTVVREKREFEKKPAYWIEVNRDGRKYFDIYDLNLNWIGSFTEGRELESAEPCIQVFKWPLRIGEKWISEYTLQDYSRGVHLPPSKVAVNVRTYEKVTVPAGTFNALRIQAGGETFWYAPCLGWAVKEQIGSCGKDGWLLELVEYSIPHRSVVKK
jgi:hypothetical protein